VNCDNFLYRFKGALTRARGLRAGRSGLDKGTLAAAHLGLLRASQRQPDRRDSLRAAAPCQVRCSVRVELPVPAGALCAGANHQQGGEGNDREARRQRQGAKGALAVGGRQPGPLPLARQRTGAGRCRHAVSPAPARWRPPPSRTCGGTTPTRAGRAVLPRRAILSPRNQAPAGTTEDYGVNRA